MSKVSSIIKDSNVIVMMLQAVLAPVLEELSNEGLSPDTKGEIERAFERTIDACVKRSLYGSKPRCHAVTKRKTLCTRYKVTDWCKMHQRIYDREMENPRKKVRCTGLTQKLVQCRRTFLTGGEMTLCRQHRPREEVEALVEVVEPSSPLDDLETQITEVRAKLQDLANHVNVDEVYAIRAQGQREILSLIGSRSLTHDQMEALSDQVEQRMSVLRQKQKVFVERYDTFSLTTEQDLLPLAAPLGEFKQSYLEPERVNSLVQRFRLITMWAKSQLPSMKRTVEDLDSYLADVVREFDRHLDEMRRRNQRIERMRSRRQA